VEYNLCTFVQSQLEKLDSLIIIKNFGLFFNLQRLNCPQEHFHFQPVKFCKRYIFHLKNLNFDNNGTFVCGVLSSNQFVEGAHRVSHPSALGPIVKQLAPFLRGLPVNIPPSIAKT
jgi:hypothetical protein